MLREWGGNFKREAGFGHPFDKSEINSILCK